MESVYAKLAEILEVDEVKPDDVLKNFDNWDSLTVLVVLDGLRGDLVERRAQLFEEILPIKIAGDARRHRSVFLQEAHAETVRTLRNLMLFVLPKGLKDDADRVEALDAVLSVDLWRRLRTDQKLTQKAALRVLQMMVDSIVT